MPYVYQVYVEYLDEELDRFWYTSLEIPEAELLTPRQLDRAVQEGIASFLASRSNYEALQNYIDSNETTPIYSVVSIVNTGP